jgi:hypothetical protein
MVTKSGAFGAGRHIYGVSIENIGKQLGMIREVSASFVVQKEARPPEPLMVQPADGTGCPIFFVGEIVIRPGGQPTGFACNRQQEVTTEEIEGMNNKTMFGFFRTGFLYADSIGVIRAAVFIFVLRPPVEANDFMQVLSVNRPAPRQGTLADQIKMQSRFIACALEIEANSKNPHDCTDD